MVVNNMRAIKMNKGEFSNESIVGVYMDKHYAGSGISVQILPQVGQIYSCLTVESPSTHMGTCSAACMAEYWERIYYKIISSINLEKMRNSFKLTYIKA